MHPFVTGGTRVAEIHSKNYVFYMYNDANQKLAIVNEVVESGYLIITLKTNSVDVSTNGDVKVSSGMDKMFRFCRTIYMSVNRILNYGWAGYTRFGTGLCGFEVNWI